MKRLLIIFLSLFVIACSSEQQDPLSGKWVDLSHDFSADTIYWPTADGFKKSTVFEGHTEKGFYYTAYNFMAAEHGGTHIDAPVHFAENKQTVDQIPLSQLIGSAVVIRVIEQVAQDRNYQFSVEDILSWEQSHGTIPDNSIVLIDTGSSKLWPDKQAYMGTDERGEEAVKKLTFPGIHPDAARLLVNDRNIKAVGLDTPSIDYGGSSLFETHQILFEHNIPGLENVANLNLLPETGALVIALPMKIKGGSGAPVRIVALLPDN